LKARPLGSVLAACPNCAHHPPQPPRILGHGFASSAIAREALRAAPHPVQSGPTTTRAAHASPTAQKGETRRAQAHPSPSPSLELPDYSGGSSGGVAAGDSVNASNARRIAVSS